jgi:hypothetical protein
MRKLWETLEGIKSRMISTTSIGSKEEPYPMISNVWDFFSTKGTKTVFVSVGTGNSCLPDLDFAETIGCKVLKLDTPEHSQKWREVADILKTRKVTETTSEFAKSATRKWVLPKNLLVEECVPSYWNGTSDYNGTTLKTQNWFDLVRKHCVETIGLAEEDVHVDILNVDVCPFENQVLESLWHTGFRPSLLLIHWCSSPDEDLQTLNTAAHLQMLGYALLGKEGKRFLYYFTDVNYFETCSWETVAKRFENPFVSNLVKTVYPGSEGTIVHFPLTK